MTANRRNNRQDSSKPRRYGLLGHPLGHSLSPFIHEGIMKALGIPGSYELFDIPPHDLQHRLPELLELDGFNTTIPHKETLFGSLDKLAPECQKLGAVNAVYQGTGYNTDIHGFGVIPITYTNKDVLILGAGGTCRVMAHYAASQEAVSITFLVRNPSRASALVQDLRNAYPDLALRVITADQLRRETRENNAPYQIILNGTPLGMWPRTGVLPLPERSYKSLLRSRRVEAVFDAIYNPTATRFVLIARSHKVTAYGGSPMLFGQALAAQAIWQGREPTADIEQVAQNRPQTDALRKVQRDLNIAIAEHSPIKWVITGFMGSGKTRLAKRLGSALPFDVKVYDLDKEIVKASGLTIEEFFEHKGEAEFRRYEREMLLDLLSGSESMIISTGGGTVVQKGCVHAIHEANGIVIALQVSLKTALLRIGDGSGRPLAQGEGGRRRVEELYRKRYPIYRATADYIVDGNRYPQRVTKYLLAAFDIPEKEKTPQPKPQPQQRQQNRQQSKRGDDRLRQKRHSKRPKKEEPR